MKLFAVTDPAFAPYGAVHDAYATDEILAAMEKIPLPDSGLTYEPSIPALEALPVFADFRDRAFGGMPIQLGLCWGRNTRLNCLEYHRDSEFNLGTHDFILLLARRDQLESGRLDTGKVMAFYVPAGVLVELYATTLHYAPCHTDAAAGFRTLIVLPRGTNTAPPATADKLLAARNKWLYAHPDSDEAKTGAYIGLVGKNIDLLNEIGEHCHE